MVKIKEIRKIAAERLKDTQNDSPLADIDYILKTMGFSKNDILLGEASLSKRQENAFKRGVRRLEKGEPVQYIAKKCEFMSLPFLVSKKTLIPRSDTETLVEAVLEVLKDKSKAKVFEVGSGSGCIAVSLAHYNKTAEVLSVDISKGALRVARKNAALNSVERRVKFKKHDILKGFPKFKTLPDVIVSNPPYINSEDIKTLDKKVKDFEPVSALDGGEDGLRFYKFLIKNAPLSNGGLLAFEVGINQAQAVSRLMSDRFSDIKIIPDLNGIERVVMGVIKER